MPNASDGEHPSEYAKNCSMINRDARPPTVLDGEAYGLLGNRRRRYLLYCLLDYGGETSLSSAVDTVTAWESDCSVEEVRSTDRRCVYSTLRRSHLPRLETEAVVTYDADAGVVALGPDAEEVTCWLDHDDDEREWSRYYLAISGVAAVLLVPEFVATLPLLLPEGGEHVVLALLFVVFTAVVARTAYR